MQFNFSQENYFLQQLALDTWNAVLKTASKSIATSPIFFCSKSESHNGSNFCFKKNYVFSQKINVECSFDKRAESQKNL